MQRILEITNATKAAAGLFVNAVIGLLVVFNVPLSDAQVGAILLAVNALGALILALTYQLSAKRVS